MRGGVTLLWKKLWDQAAMAGRFGRTTIDFLALPAHHRSSYMAALERLSEKESDGAPSEDLDA